MLYGLFLSLLLVYGIFVIYSIINGYKIKKENYLKFNDNLHLEILEKPVSDTIRGIAILMIMLAHIVQQLGDRLEIPFFGGIYIKLIVFTWGGVGVGVFFLLSGFGNMASLMKNFTKPNFSKINWILKRLIRLGISFIFSFILVVLNTKIFGVCKYSYKDLGLQFIQLKLPDCSTWYLKIQILLYILIFISFFLAGKIKIQEINKYYISSAIICTILVFFYAVVANFYLKLPDYWWKTCICFVVGVFLYLFKYGVLKKQENKGFKISLIVITFLLFSLSYIYTLKKPLSFLNIVSFSVISFAIIYFFDSFNVRSNILSKIGNISLELYLMHIGFMSIIETDCFSFMKECAVPFNIVLFISLSFIFAFGTNYLNTKIMKIIPLK